MQMPQESSALRATSNKNKKKTNIEWWVIIGQLCQFTERVIFK